MFIKSLIKSFSSWSSSKNRLAVPVSIADFDVYKEQEIPEEIARKISEATSSVRMCFYKFHASSNGGSKIIKAFKALAEKSSETQPIHVSILLNERGVFAQQLYKVNEKSGLEELAALQKQFPHFKIKIHYHRAKALDTYHAKTIVIDPDQRSPHIFFCGGDIQKANDPARHQYETALMVQSREMALVAARDFDNLVHAVSTQVNNSFASMMQRLTRSDLLTTQATKATHNALYLSSRAQGNPLNAWGMSPFKKALIESIQDAKSEIHLLTPNLNDKNIIYELAQAANRGVQIKLVMGKHHNDQVEQFFGGTNLSNINYLDSLINKKHKSFLRIHWAKNPKTNTLVLHGDEYTMHGKFCMVDKKLLLMGSSPLDKQAMQCSREIDAVMQIPSSKKADDILNKLFNTPYALGGDYYVDKIINLLAKEHRRLLHYSDPIAQNKVIALERVLTELNAPSVTATMALTMLNDIRPVIKVKRHSWHWVEPKSLKTLDQCRMLCTCSSSALDDEEYRQATLIKEQLNAPLYNSVQRETEQKNKVKSFEVEHTTFRNNSSPFR